MKFEQPRDDYRQGLVSVHYFKGFPSLQALFSLLS